MRGVVHAEAVPRFGQPRWHYRRPGDFSLSSLALSDIALAARSARAGEFHHNFPSTPTHRARDIILCYRQLGVSALFLTG